MCYRETEAFLEIKLKLTRPQTMIRQPLRFCLYTEQTCIPTTRFKHAVAMFDLYKIVQATRKLRNVYQYYERDIKHLLFSTQHVKSIKLSGLHYWLALFIPME